MTEPPHTAAQTTSDVADCTTVDSERSMLSPNRERKRRIRFGPDLDVILLKSVIACDAHVAEHGTSQQKFEEALTVFISSTPRGRLQNVTSPTWKTIYERFKKVVSDYRASDRRDSIASRVEENRSERDLLLDDIIQHQDEHQETQRNERNERTETERRLQEAGDRIRTAAVQRASAVGPSDDADEVNEVSSSVNPRSLNGRYKRRREVVEWERDEDEWIKEHMRMQSAIEEKRSNIEEGRLKLEQDAMIKTEMREGRKLELEEEEHELKKRRMAHDEKILDLEKEKIENDISERKGQAEERRKLLDVLAALAKRLS